MVKILFFLEELRAGGAEKVLCNLVNEMDQSRFDVTVQTLWKADHEQYLKPGIRYRWCYSHANWFTRYRSRLEAATGLTYALHMKDDYDIEVAYLEFGSTKILAGSTNKQAKKVAWIHCDLKQKLCGNPEAVEKLTRQYAAYDRIVCVSRTVKEGVVQLFGRENDTTVLYNTVNDTAIRNKALAVLPDFPVIQKLTVVTVGRLASEKQFDMLLRVHKQLLDEGHIHDLWIVGEGDERRRLETLIADNDLNDTVRLCGYQANPYPYMKVADLLVCSSRYEGLSTFVTEGLILGKPIVTTECSGMREILGDSAFGMITKNSEESLLNGMRQMLSDPALRKEYAFRAEVRGRAFSARQLTENVENYFIKLIKE